MFLDIVFPKDNEKEFEKIAKRLGISLCFAYPYSKDFGKKPDFTAVLAKKGQVRAARKVADLVIMQAKDSLGIFDERPDIVFGFEKLKDRDKIFYRNSGINVAMARKASEKKCLVGISISDIINSTDLGKTLGRIQLNLKLSKKYKFSVCSASFATSPSELRNSQDILALIKILSDTKTANSSINAVYNKALEIKGRKEGSIIGKGIRVSHKI